MNPINRQKAIQPELNHSHEESMHVARAFLREIMNQHKKDPFYLKKIKTQSDKIILISDKNRKITIPKKNSTNNKHILLSYNKKDFDKIVKAQEEGLSPVVIGLRMRLLLIFKDIMRIQMNDIVSNSLKNDIVTLKQAIASLKKKYGIKIACYDLQRPLQTK